MPPGQTCPLSKRDAATAAAAFAGLLPVLQHPRCINCHGVFADLQENRATKHPGRFVPAGMSVSGDDCVGCHDLGAIPTPDGMAWRLPPPHMFFTQDPVSICKRFRSTGAATGADFLNHLFSDAAIGLGFAGKKGQSDLPAEPPPMSRDAFLALAEQWVAALYRSSDQSEWARNVPGEPGSACGCDPNLYARIASGTYKAVVTHGDLRFESTWTLKVDGDSASGMSRWDCCPDPRNDPLIDGRITEGKRLTIVRNCTGGGAGNCLQTFDGEVDANGVIVGTWTGSYRNPDLTAIWTLTPVE
jgi:hypothetical protein